MKNKIICGDSLEVLKKIEPESVDLIYLDPPFSSNRNYTGIWDKTEEELSFDDSHWDEGVKGYIKWLKERVNQCFRVLKPTGSIYLHCDWHASHYIKVMIDKVAQDYGGKFQNEIVWKRTDNPKGSQYKPRKYGVSTDTIFFYSKSNEYFFDVDKVRIKLTDDEIKKKYNRKDSRGRYYPGPIVRSKSMGERKKLCYTYKGYKPLSKSGWRMKEEKLKKLDEDGNLGWSKSGSPFRKLRPENDKGKPIYNLWEDIPRVRGNESIGYPTQKPEKLLERIIKASSNEGDVVLDPFCGCGTTLSVASQLGRKFIGIDISRMAIKVMATRLKEIRNWTESKYLSEKVNIESFEWETVFPTDITDIKKYDWRNFQDWVCEKFGAMKGKRGADGGIDGATITNVAIYDIIEKRLIALPPETIIQSKHFRTTKIGEPYLKKFESTIRHNNKKEGIMVAWGFAKTAKQYVSSAKEKGISIYCVEAKWLYTQSTPKGPYADSYKVGRKHSLDDYQL